RPMALGRQDPVLTLGAAQRLDRDDVVARHVPGADGDDDSDGADDGDGAFMVAEFDAETAELADWLAAARDYADVAASANARGHNALYQAIGRAWGLARAAQQSPDDFAELIAEAGIAPSPRAPMTPVVKLVFGAQHDKTRLAEYGAVLNHASAQSLDPLALPAYLSAYQGGLKGLLRDARAHARAGAQPVDPMAGIADVLRVLPGMGTADMDDGSDAADDEFTLLVARRNPMGGYTIMGQLAQAHSLTARAMRHIAPAKRA
ncbi:MAG: hypothetical protein ACKOUM_08815, partial [Sphingopyxis sp.]